MEFDLKYHGSFQRRRMRFPSDNPLKEVWSQITRIGTIEYTSSMFTTDKTDIDWSQHTNYATVRVRQATELWQSGRNASLLTKPITLYYSFLNLLRAVMALVPEVIGPSHHGLIYKGNTQLLLSEAKFVSGTFGSYLDCLNLPWKRNSTITLRSCLAKIPEICLEYKSPDRGAPEVKPITVQGMMRTGEVKLIFDSRFLEESQFRSNWSIDYPSLKSLCRLDEKGCVLIVQERFKNSTDGGYDDICNFCEKNFWNRLTSQNEPVWYVLQGQNTAETLNRISYYFIAIFILGSIARYNPELLQSSLKPGSESEWFFERFMSSAERFFPQLIFSWAQGRETYFPSA